MNIVSRSQSFKNRLKLSNSKAIEKSLWLRTNLKPLKATCTCSRQRTRDWRRVSVFAKSIRSIWGRPLLSHRLSLRITWSKSWRTSSKSRLEWFMKCDIQAKIVLFHMEATMRTKCGNKSGFLKTRSNVWKPVMPSKWKRQRLKLKLYLLRPRHSLSRSEIKYKRGVPRSRKRAKN